MLEQDAVTGQLLLRSFQLGLILCQLPTGLIQLHLICTGVDFSQQVARLHTLAILEVDALQHAIDLTADRNGLQRLDRGNGIDRLVDQALLDRGNLNRDFGSPHHAARPAQRSGRT